MVTPTPEQSRATLGDDGPTRELRVLNAIAQALNSSTDVEQALQRTLSLVTELLNLRTGWIWLLDAGTGHFYLGGAQELPPYLQEPVRMTGHKCWCIGSFLAGELTPKNIDVMECSRLRPAVKQVEQTSGLNYHASIPLYFQGKPLGIMNVTTPSWRKLSRGELRLLSTIGYQVGIAVERARLAEEGIRLARAEERARIAREIHDTLAQDLTAIGLQIEGAIRQLESDPEQARERLGRALATSRGSLEEARRSVLNLRATPLDGKPLADALAAMGRAFTSETGIRVRVRATGPTVPTAIEPELYRIAQEALANVRRHAHAHDVEVHLDADDRSIRLSIRDDGRGFDPRLRPEDRHGLAGMRERAKLVGGRLRIESRPGHGTRVAVTVPRAPEKP